jgi:hypothetical protein
MAAKGPGQKVDENIFGPEQKDIESRVSEFSFPLGAAGHADGLDPLDLEWLDAGAHGPPW